MNELCRLIGELAEYGVKTGLIPASERNYAINLLLDIFHVVIIILHFQVFYLFYIIDDLEKNYIFLL